MTTALILAALLACGDDDSDSGDGHDHDHGDGGSSMVDTGTLDFGTTQDSSGGTYSVSYTTTPSPLPFNEEFSIDFAATPDVMPEGGFTITAADATMPNHGHGMNVSPVVTDNGDGTATAAPFLFHMEGWWEITVEITSDDGTETAAFNFWCCD